MTDINRISSELIAVPPVLLTGPAFAMAREQGFTGIEPNPANMQAIAELTDAPILPDITLMRLHSNNPRRWDQAYQYAASDFPYIPAGQLAIDGSPRQTIPAETIRRVAQQSGRAVLDLSVKDWSLLGLTLADAIEELKTIQQAPPKEYLSRATNAFGAIIGGVIKGSRGLSPRQLRVSRAADIHPYDLIKGDPA